MAWFGQGKDTIEWNESRPDVLFYKWPNSEIKKGSRLVIRAGQKAIFYAGGRVEGIFEDQGNFDITTEIVPFLSTLSGVFKLRGDSGMRAEVYFVNAKELLLPWGTRQRIMIPTNEVPSGVPVGMNGNLIIEFRDYLQFITKVAGVKSTYALGDISERIMGEFNPIVAECILQGQNQVGVNVLFDLQRNSRKLGKLMEEELDKELLDIGLGVADVNILSINYPEEVQRMAEKVAAQSFVQDTGKFAAVNLADSFSQPGGGDSVAGMGAQMAMGMAMAQQMSGAFQPQQAAQPAAPQPAPAAPAASGSYVCSGCGKTYDQPAKFCQDCGQAVQAAPAPAAAGGDRFCPQCRKMCSGKFCPDCGGQTV